MAGSPSWVDMGGVGGLGSPVTRLDFGGASRPRARVIEDVADFILADANGDGVLTLDELDAYGARKGAGVAASSSSSSRTRSRR